MAFRELQHLFPYFPSQYLEYHEKIYPFLLHSRNEYDKISTCVMEIRAYLRTSIMILEVFIMGALVIIITILQVLCGVTVVLAVLFQSGKNAGLSSAIGGSSDSFMAKSKAKSFDAKLAKATKWIGAVFILLTLLLNILH